MMNERLLTVGALARRLGVRPEYLRQSADRGELPHVRAGDQLLFDGDLVERLLLERARSLPSGTETDMLIAIDPGDQAGVALFEDSKLVRVELVRAAVDRAWKWDGPTGTKVVCEAPQVRHEDKMKMKHLLTLAVTTGYLIGAMQPVSIHRVVPREWKGQRPKTVDNQLTLRLLSDQERQVLDRSNVSRGMRHNLLDAIGLGLWELKRR